MSAGKGLRKISESPRRGELRRRRFDQSDRRKPGRNPEDPRSGLRGFHIRSDLVSSKGISISFLLRKADALRLEAPMRLRMDKGTETRHVDRIELPQVNLVGAGREQSVSRRSLVRSGSSGEVRPEQVHLQVEPLFAEHSPGVQRLQTGSESLRLQSIPGQTPPGNPFLFGERVRRPDRTLIPFFIG